MKNIFQLTDPRADKAYLLAAKQYLVYFPCDWSAIKLRSVLIADEEDTENYNDRKAITIWEPLDNYMEKKGDYFCDQFYLADLIHHLANEIYFF